MFARILKGNRNFIPITIFFLFGVVFFFLNAPDLGVQTNLISIGLLALTLLHSALIINHFPYFRENYYFTFLLAIGFLFISSGFSDINFFAGLFMLLIIMVQILYSYQHENYILNGFDLGFFLGFAIIFEPSFWLFALFLIISFVVKGKTELRSLLFVFIGLLAFTILAFEIVAVWDLWHLYDAFVQKLNFNLMQWEQKYFFLILILVPFVLGIIDYYQHINRQSASKKLVFFDALLFLLIAMIVVVLYGGNNANYLLILLIPIFLIISNFLTYNQKYWQKEAAIGLILVALLLYRFHSFIELPEIFDQVTF